MSNDPLFLPFAAAVPEVGDDRANDPADQQGEEDGVRVAVGPGLALGERGPEVGEGSADDDGRNPDDSGPEKG